MQLEMSCHCWLFFKPIICGHHGKEQFFFFSFFNITNRMDDHWGFQRIVQPVYTTHLGATSPACLMTIYPMWIWNWLKRLHQKISQSTSCLHIPQISCSHWTEHALDLQRNSGTKILLLWQRENNQKVSKADFSNILGGVWSKGISRENIKSGFLHMEIYPWDPIKYPVSQFNNEKVSHQADNQDEIAHSSSAGGRRSRLNFCSNQGINLQNHSR